MAFMKYYAVSTPMKVGLNKIILPKPKFRKINLEKPQGPYSSHSGVIAGARQ